jgi:hypothetical protein
VLLGGESAELGALGLVLRGADAPKEASADRVLAMGMALLGAAPIEAGGLCRVLRNTLAVLEAAPVVAAGFGEAAIGGELEEVGSLGQARGDTLAKGEAVPVVVLALRIVVGGGDLIIVVRTSCIEWDALAHVVAETNVARRCGVAFACGGHQQLETFIHILRDAVPVKKKKPKKAAGIDVAGCHTIDNRLHREWLGRRRHHCR